MTTSSPSGMDPPLVASSATTSSIPSSSWQYEWKRPEWKRHKESKNSSINKKKTKCLDITSTYYNHSNIHDDDDDNNSREKDSSIIGDVLTVSLWEDDTLQYLVLQPPLSNSNVTKTSNDNKNNPEEIIWKWPLPSFTDSAHKFDNHDDRQNDQLHPKPLVSINLCHIPTSLLYNDNNENKKQNPSQSSSNSQSSSVTNSMVLGTKINIKKKSFKSKKAHDLDIHQALDILDSLSFQQSTTHRNFTTLITTADNATTMTSAVTNNISSADEASNKDKETDQGEETSNNNTDLALACTTSTGCVYLYRLRGGLLSKSQNNANNDGDNNPQEQTLQVWSDWILGSTLQSILSKEYLHWNHSKYCVGTYQLIPKQKYKTNADKKYKYHGNRIIESTIVTPHYLVLQQTAQSLNNTNKSQPSKNSKSDNKEKINLLKPINFKWLSTLLPTDMKKVENKSSVDQCNKNRQIKTQTSTISTADTEIHDNRTHSEKNEEDNDDYSNSTDSSLQSKKSNQDSEDFCKNPFSENFNDNINEIEKDVATDLDLIEKKEKEDQEKVKEEQDKLTSTLKLPMVVEEEDGCWLSFVSLQYLSETNKSVWIPFVPTVLKPVIWFGFHLLIVLGDSLEKAVAIRVDTFPHLRFSKADNFNASDPHQYENRTHDNFNDNSFMIFKFIPIPIHFDLDENDIEKDGEFPCAVTSMMTNPPAIITKSSKDNKTTLYMYTLTEFNIMDDIDKFPQKYNHPIILQTRRCQKHFATLPSPRSSYSLTASIKTKQPFWCLSGQGWSLVGENQTVYFVSWEGATAAAGATTKEIGCHNNDGNVLLCNTMPLQFTMPTLAVEDLNSSSILELSALTDHDDNIPIANGDSIVMLCDETSINSNSTGGVNSHYDSFYYGLGARNRSTNSTNDYDHDYNSHESFHHGNASSNAVMYDDIVIDALDSVKSLPINDSVSHVHFSSEDIGAKTSSDLKRSKNKNTRYNNELGSAEESHRRLRISSKTVEKRLLYRCTSWTQLDDTVENRALINRQLNVGTIFLGSDQFSLRLRRNVVTNGVATPFPQVLSWLCQNKDYCTAASIALNLLHDFEAVRDLRAHTYPSHYNSHYDSSTPSYLEGLLDGIIPLDKNDFLQAEQQFKDSRSTYLESNNNKLHNIITSLADMAVGCLVRGGVNMSLTLLGFLGRNIFYSASRACLMLTACANKTVEQVLEDEKFEEKAEVDLISFLWPIQCLLRVAVVRDCMRTALILLNGVIPDVLRRRRIITKLGDEKIPSLNLCKSIIGMIVASSASATSILIDIVEEDTQESYWQSLHHDTRLEISLIKNVNLRDNEYYPFLYEPEVRMWALDQLTESIQKESCGSNDDKSSLSLPEEWLRNICYGCLLNAGCNISLILQKSTYNHDVFCNDVDYNVEDRYTRVQKEFVRSMQSIFSDCNPSGLDFNLLIPALLLLQKRTLPWHTHSSVSTQSLLCFVCDLAGKPPSSTGVAGFGFDEVLAMKQCGIMENIMAGANLIGGHEGLVLQCVDILMKYAYLSMNEAESVLLYGQRDDKVKLLDTTSIDQSSSSKHMDETNRSSTCAKITDGHKRLLWLIEKYVLSIEKYGDLEPCRGKINPDVAAITCFRAWVSLNQSGNFKSRGSLLSSWLQAQLFSPCGETCKNRLACAILARVLLWPTNSSNSLSYSSDEEDVSNEEGYSHSSHRHKVLAELLEFDPSFLIDLSIHCCGMVQSVPPSVADDIFSSYIQNQDKNHPYPSHE